MSTTVAFVRLWGVNARVRRLAALFIDYALIAAYAVLLFGLTVTVYLVGWGRVPDVLGGVGPVGAHVIGLVTLTIPVATYLYFSEASRHQSTIGKRILGLAVLDATTGERPSRHAIALRTIAKLAPWEIAHWSVHRVVYYENYLNSPAPMYLAVLLVLANVLVVLYVGAVLLTPRLRGPHDYVAWVSPRMVETSPLRK